MKLSHASPTAYYNLVGATCETILSLCYFGPYYTTQTRFIGLWQRADARKTQTLQIY